MKIAFIGQKGLPAGQGGIENHVEKLSVKLAQAGFDVTVYSRPHYTGKKIYAFKGVRIISLPSLNTKHLDAISHTFLATVHALFQDYDVIHYHGVGPSLLSFIPRLFKPRVKVLVTFHSLDRQQRQKWGWLARIILSLGEKTACYFPHETIVISQTLQKYCQFRFDKSTVYIPNGVEVAANTADSAILKHYQLKKNNYLLTVSRLVQSKGLEILIEAYQQSGLKQKLVIVGGEGAHNNNYAKELKGLAAKNPNIIFTGEQSGAALQALFQNAYLFVQPSETEGLSIALLEALAYGLPVVVSDIPANLEAIGNVGLTFQNKNVNDLTRQLQLACSHSAKLKKQAWAAKNIISKKYDWTLIAKQTAELYQQTVEMEKEYQFKTT